MTRHAGWVCVGVTAVAGLYVGCHFSPIVVQADEATRVSVDGTSKADTDNVDQALFEADPQMAPRVFRIGGWNWRGKNSAAAKPTSKFAPFGRFKKQAPVDPFLDEDEAAAEEADVNAETDSEADLDSNDRGRKSSASPTDRKGTPRNERSNRKRLQDYQSSKKSAEEDLDEPTETPKTNFANSKTQRLAPLRSAKPTVAPVEDSEEFAAPVPPDVEPNVQSEEELRSLFEKTTEPVTEEATEAEETPAERESPADKETPEAEETPTAPPATERRDSESDASEFEFVPSGPEVSVPEPEPVAKPATARKPAPAARPVTVPQPSAAPAKLPPKRVVPNHPVIPIEEFDAPNPARVKAREQRKRTRPMPRVTQTNARQPDELAARVKVDQAEAKQTVAATQSVVGKQSVDAKQNFETKQIVEVKQPPAVRKLPELASPPVTKPLPELQSTPHLIPAGVVKPSVVVQRRAEVAMPIIRPGRAGNTTGPRTLVPHEGPLQASPKTVPREQLADTTQPRVLANRAMQIEPPPGWSAATKLSSHRTDAPTTNRPVERLDRSAAEPHAVSPQGPELPSPPAQNRRASVEPVMLNAIEAVGAVQFARATGKSPAKLNSAIFVRPQSETNSEPNRIQDAYPEPVVIPVLAAQNQSPWRWWVMSAFVAGVGTCWLACRWFRRSETY